MTAPCRHVNSGHGPCEGPAKYKVVFRSRRTRQAISHDQPFCFAHALREVDRAEAAASIAIAELEEIR